MDNIQGSVSIMNTVNGSISKSGAVLKTELVFNSKNMFPQQGSSDFLYIATDENKCYRYDEAFSGYVSVGVGFSSIQCRLKEE